MFRKGGAVALTCLLLGVGGCGLGEAQRERQAIVQENRELYQMYRDYRQTQNAKRQQAGMPPLTIKSYEEWQQAPGLD